MNIFVVRHAEAEHNVPDVANDITSAPSHLTLNGKMQAKALAEKLHEYYFDIVFTSELIRTIETANILVDGRGLVQKTDARLNDIVTGMQGKPFNEYRLALSAASDKWNFKAAHGESPNEVTERVRNFIESLKSQPYENVLIVTHGWVANSIYGFAYNLTNEEMFNRPVFNTDMFIITL